MSEWDIYFAVVCIVCIVIVTCILDRDLKILLERASDESTSTNK